MQKPLRVLNVEDSERDEALLKRHLVNSGYEITAWQRVDRPGDMMTALTSSEWDVILCDYVMPEFDALKALTLLHQTEIDIPFIIISGTVGEQVAVAAMLSGAHDYLSKENLTRLVPAIERELKESNNRRELRQVEEARHISEARYRSLFEYAPDGIIVSSPDDYYLDANTSMCQMLGYDHQELVGMHARDIVIRSEARELESEFTLVQSTPDYNREWHFKRKDGSVFPADVIAAIMPDGNLLAMIRDTSERTLADDKLRESEYLLEASQRITHLGSWVIELSDDGKWQNEHWSDEHYRIFGVKPGEFEITDENFYKLVHPDDRQRLAKTIDEAHDQHKPFDIEHRIIRPDGSERVVHAKAELVLNAKTGKPEKLVGSVQDITERKRAEEALIASEERYRSVVDTAPDVIVTIDDSNTIRFINPAAERIFGYGVEELKGASLSMLMPEYLRHLHDAGLKRYQETGVKHVPWDYVEVTGLHKSGHEIPITISFSEFIQGEKRFFTGIIRDITDRKRAMEALQASEERYRELVENALDIIYTHDLEGNYTSVNKAAETLTGFSRDEILAMNIADAIPVEELETAKKVIAAKLAGEEAPAHEVELRTKDGLGVMVEVNSRIIYENGIPIGVQGIARDITERKVLEAELELQRTEREVLLNSIGEGVQWIDLDGHIRFENPAGAKMLGYEMSELIGKPSHPTIHHTHADGTGFPRTDCGIYATLHDGVARRVTDEVFWRKDGTSFDVEYVCTPVFDREGDPRGAVVVFSDITERKRAEKALRETNRRIEDIVNSVEGIVWEADAQTFIFTFISTQAEQILGYPTSRWFDEPTFWADHIHPDDRDAAVAFCHNSTRDLLSHEFEYRMLAKDGRVIWIKDTVTVFAENGQAVKLRGIMMDITERKLGEDALLESETRLRAIFDTEPECVKLLAEDGSVLEMNAAGLRMIEADSFEQVANRSVYGLIAENDRVAFQDLVEKVFQGESGTLEFQIVGLKGTHRWMDTHASPLLDATGKVTALVGITRDVTKRKEADDALSESNEKFHQLADNISDVFWIRSPDMTKIHYISPAYEQIWGRKLREDYADPHEWYEYIYPQDRQRVKEAYAGLMNDWPEMEVEFRILRPDGEQRWVRARGFQVKDQSGEVIRLAGIVTDITTHKQSETSLVESQEQLKLATEAASIGIWDWDLVEGSMNWDARMYDLYGNHDKDFRGSRETWNLNHLPEDHDRVLEELAVAEQGPGDFHSEFRVVWPSGEVRHLESSAKVIRDKNGKALRFIGVNWDITERKLAEETLREADQRAIREYGLLLSRVSKLALALGDARDLETVFEQLHEFAHVSTGMDALTISLFDAKQMTRTAAYVWSDGVKIDVSGLPPMEMSDSPHSRSVLTGEIVVTDDYQSAMEGQPVLHLTGERPQSSLVVPMSVMGKVVGGVEMQSNQRAAFTDSHATALQMAANLAANAIENVRLLEIERTQAEQLRQSQKMEAVGVLAGGIAHDFNNLLTAINGYSDMTLRKMEAESPFRHSLEEINKAGNRAAELTTQLLAFSRKQVLKSSVINLNSVISNIEKMLRRIIRESIELNVFLEPDLGNVMADPGQIEQVIMNLAINARDAMPDGGSLTIETKNVHLDQQFAQEHLMAMGGDFIRMTVSDSGEGMDAATRAHIFEPFFTTKEVGKGTGLGLATVHGIVQQSGGTITVYSEVGHGSTFKVYLPCVDEAVDRPSWPTEHEAGDAGTETILLVEDEDAVRGFLVEVLESSGYTVLAAASGASALTIIQEHPDPIHLLITDVIMPKMGGTELKNHVVKLIPDIKILFISGYTDDSITGRGIDDRSLAFLEKPFTPDSLIRKVRGVLESA